MSDMKSNKNKLYTIGFIVLILALVFVLWYFGVPSGSNASLDAFAKCLADKKITMYGAEWCPHCQNEKRGFGESFKYVPYVECPEEPARCTTAGVDAYPTWILPDGRKFVGEQGVQKLSELSGCPLPSSTSSK